MPRRGETLRAAVTPDVTVLTLLVALSAGLARLTGDAELRSLTTLMAYYNRHGERGDPGPARALLGTPEIPLDQWLRQRTQERLVVAPHP